ncbi:hypothetical protein GCM10009610_69190 [Pseudonocardia xinjiangensis]
MRSPPWSDGGEPLATITCVRRHAVSTRRKGGGVAEAKVAWRDDVSFPGDKQRDELAERERAGRVAV